MHDILHYLDPYMLSFISLFVAVDAVGNIPIFLSLTDTCTKRQRKEIIFQSVATATLIAVMFMFIGKLILRALDVSIPDFQIAGGTMLFFISMRLLLPTTTKGFITPENKTDYGVFPLATPLITGPAVLTTTLVMTDTYGMVPTFAALIANMLIVWFTLSKSEFFTRLMGKNGLKAVSKIVYILLAAIGVMMIRRGIVAVVTGFTAV